MKKPSPAIARSSVRSVELSEPCVNCWTMPVRRTPWPATDLVLCVGAEANRSPKVALLFLKPVELELAMLFETVARSVCAALRPLSEVMKDIWAYSSVKLGQ